MDTATPIDNKDQATGLRHLFGQPPTPVHVLHCPARPALCLPLAQVLSHQLADRGHTVLWVDELGMVERENWPLPCKVRFDLSKSLQGHVPLDQTVRPLSPTLWYGLSLHTARIAHAPAPLTERLQGSGVRFESVVVTAGPQKSEGLPHYGTPIHVSVITECDAGSLQKTLTWMQLAQAQGPVSSWSVVLAGSKARLNHGIHWIEHIAAAHLSQDVKLLSTVDTKVLAAPLAQAWLNSPDLTDLLLHHLLTR
jgi:hypothetical protein